MLVEVGDEESGTKWVREPVDPRTINEATYRARKAHQRGKDHEMDRLEAATGRMA